MGLITFTLPQELADDLVSYLDDEDIYPEVIDALLKALPVAVDPQFKSLEPQDDVSRYVIQNVHSLYFSQHPNSSLQFGKWKSALGPIDDPDMQDATRHSWWCLTVDGNCTFATADYWKDWVQRAEFQKHRSRVYGWYQVSTDRYVQSPRDM